MELTTSSISENQLSGDALERAITGKAVLETAKRSDKFKDIKSPGFFESRGLSFKLSFPKTNLLQGLREMARSAASSFSKTVNTVGSFSFKDALGKISLNFFMKSSSSTGDSEDTTRRTTFFEPVAKKGNAWKNYTGFRLEEAQAVLADSSQWQTDNASV